MSTKEQKQRIELLQGTLDLLILRTLLRGPAHGHAIAKAIEFSSDDVLQVEQGSLYPALHRLIKRRWISVEEGTTTAAMIERAIWGVDRDVTVSDVQTMSAVISRANSQARFDAALLGAFAAVALVMSAVGIYGVMSYAVTSRRHEIGIRMALGASHLNVLASILRLGMALALAGSATGFLGGLILSRVMATLLYGVRAGDPLTFTGAAALLTIVALAACYLPARDATRVDPMVALRYE